MVPIVFNWSQIILENVIRKSDKSKFLLHRKPAPRCIGYHYSTTSFNKG